MLPIQDLGLSVDGGVLCRGHTVLRCEQIRLLSRSQTSEVSEFGLSLALTDERKELNRIQKPEYAAGRR